MDHLSDDEEDARDEEAGERARLEQQQRDERDATKRIIAGVVDGFDKSRQSKKGQMSFSLLTKDRFSNKKENGADEAEEEFDEEEALQVGMCSIIPGCLHYIVLTFLSVFSSYPFFPSCFLIAGV